MQEQLQVNTPVYVTNDEGREVIGDHGVITGIKGELYSVATSHADGEQGMWLTAEDLSVTEPAEEDADAEERDQKGD